MSEETKKKLLWAGGLAAVIFVGFIWPHTYNWDGDGSINVFPSSASVKNYRLDATMTVTRHKNGWIQGYDEYSDIQGNWPDGGNLELSGCVVRDKNQANCTDQDGKSYGIEIETAPDPPPPDDTYDTDY